MISDQYYYHRLSKENQIVYKKIYEGLLKHKDYILCTNVDYNVEEFQKLIDAVHFDNPFFYYVNFGKIVFSRNALGLAKITFQYYFDVDKCNELNAKIEKYTKAIINRANIKDGSEAEIVKGLYDVLALNITYDCNALNMSTDSEQYIYAHTILGVLLKRSAVCEGTSLAFKYLLNALGVKCIFVTGHANSINNKNTKENHSWNIVKINKENYHIDLTWGNASTMDGVINYDYYGLTDDDILKDHKIFTTVPICESISENYFYKNNLIVNSEAELIEYVQQAIANDQPTIYIKLNYNADIDKTIQISQEKIIESLISKGEIAAIRSSGCKEQNTVLLHVMKK